jgi:two-component system, cell cycle response regulator
MRVLIAEDDVTSRLLLQRVLARWDYEVIATKDGVEALEALRAADAPRLAVLDWMMPGLDGVEVCRRVRELDTEQPPYVILLTARGGKEDIVRGLDSGANDYLGKPFDPEELRARVEVGRRFIELNERLIEAQHALEIVARTDALTGILNRGAIVRRLEEEMARALRENVALSVGMLDIDHFKCVNDTHGHAVGDIVLRAVVQRSQTVLRRYDVLGRFGGEEFLVIVPGAESPQALEILERIRSTVADSPILVEGRELTVTVSVGGATSRGEPIDRLLIRADDELYHAKEQGRNRVVIAGPS